MEQIRDILQRIKSWDRASTEQEILREESKARAAETWGFGREPGLVSYILELRQREEAGEAAYDITSLLWQLASIDPNSRQTFETWKLDKRYPVLEEARDSVRAWSQLKGEPFLTLAGPPGTGKTHLAKAAAQAMVSSEGIVMYRGVSQLLDELRQATLRDRREEVMADVRLTTFLILDDLGTEKLSEWALAAMDEIVDLRYSMGQNLLVCTNQKSEDLPARIADRLSDKAIGKVIQLAVPSFRRGR